MMIGVLNDELLPKPLNIFLFNGSILIKKVQAISVRRVSC